MKKNMNQTTINQSNVTFSCDMIWSKKNL